MANITIKKGLDLNLDGAPAASVSDIPMPEMVTIYPTEFARVKPRLEVKEGDTVKHGQALFHNKKNESFRLRSPVAGTVDSIVRGKRRVLEQINIRVDTSIGTEELPTYTREKIKQTDGRELRQHLYDTGLIALVVERPFSRIPDPEVFPKSIFVNAMGTAPLQAQPEVALEGQDDVFQAGLDALGRMTEGSVHLCTAVDPAPVFAHAEGVEKHTFAGPHPAGLSSTHIHHIDPILPHEAVWAVRAADVAQIGRLLTEGRIPSHRIVATGGNGLNDEARRYYRAPIGASFTTVFDGSVKGPDNRFIRGDVLSGTAVSRDEGIRYGDHEISVLPEGRERYFLGWLAPGMKKFSASRLFLSRWLNRDERWSLDTSRRGSKRAMVLTGWYDKYVPLDIMTDYLVRAVLAHDTDEAIQLGILETDPEDFALPAMICPSKTDICGIIRNGLAEIEEEGI